ncbi:MAG: hypothetical protein ACTSQO_05955 [Candidatus Helarchaeota archaeon]
MIIFKYFVILICSQDKKNISFDVERIRIIIRKDPLKGCKELIGKLLKYLEEYGKLIAEI